MNTRTHVVSLEEEKTKLLEAIKKNYKVKRIKYAWIFFFPIGMLLSVIMLFDESILIKVCGILLAIISFFGCELLDNKHKSFVGCVEGEQNE